MSYYDAEEIYDLKMENIKLERQNKELRQKLNRATEALKFYADPDCYSDFGKDGLSEVDEDCGEFAQKVLEEIEE